MQNETSERLDDQSQTAGPSNDNKAPASAPSPKTNDFLSILKDRSQLTSQLSSLLLPAPGCSSPEPSTSSSPTGTDKTDNHDLFIRNVADMRREDERIKTFDNWPVPFLSPELLAKNGFYYLKRGDEVRCAFCKVEIMKWMVGDDPATDHQRWAPQCPFLRRQAASGNVPLEDGGRDECGVHVPPPAPTPVRMPGPKHPHYSSEDARLRTFSDWPRSMRQKPEELAEAGFFYTGQGDKTKCFYCDGGLKDWENDDVPWEQHARWFSRCAYVQLVKGREYIQKVISQAEAVSNTNKEDTEQKFETKPKDKQGSEDDSKLCKICYNEELNICFVPCGHVVACAKCALSTDKCPMCRRTFTNAVRLYFS
ncbi:unnamed protein product [Danaus chrysippus]|uniref:(African queen) hypothetical protein n=1 Tax=Danaus chrysippus TaxID=151541 RepID=A0A8J2QHB0_9NEOP|nr:unnamed protein product [Danaus chrysippus]